MRLRFFFNIQPDISDVGCDIDFGPRSSNATKKVSRLEVLIENELSTTKGPS